MTDTLSTNQRRAVQTVAGPVLIVAGAGMVGACTAFALAQRGMRVALVEPAPAQAQAEPPAQYDLRVSAISPGSRRILQQLGIWQQLDAERICYYEQMHIWHQHGRASVSFDAVDLARDDLGAIVENRQLQQALQRACEAEARIEWFRPDSVLDSTSVYEVRKACR